MSEETSLEEAAHQRKQLRRVGYGIALGGGLAALVTFASSRPRPIVVYGLLGLAVAVFVLEFLEVGASGTAVGLLMASIGGWIWPLLGGASYRTLGVTLVVVGLVNAAVTPYFRDLGERLADR